VVERGHPGTMARMWIRVRPYDLWSDGSEREGIVGNGYRVSAPHGRREVVLVLISETRRSVYRSPDLQIRYRLGRRSSPEISSPPAGGSEGTEIDRISGKGAR